MDFKHDFWSILGQSTYLAFGLSCLKVSIHSTKLIPVAIGTTKQEVADCTPESIKIYNKYNSLDLS